MVLIAFKHQKKKHSNECFFNLIDWLLFKQTINPLFAFFCFIVFLTICIKIFNEVVKSFCLQISPIGFGIANKQVNITTNPDFKFWRSALFGCNRFLNNYSFTWYSFKILNTFSRISSLNKPSLFNEVFFNKSLS